MTAALWIGGTQVYCRLGAAFDCATLIEKGPTVTDRPSTPGENAAWPRSTNSG